MTPDASPPTLDAFERCAAMDVPLAEKLRLLATDSLSRNPQFAAPVAALIARLNAAGAGSNAPQTGEPMPPFYLPDETGRLVALDDLRASGPVVVVFHRGNWCPYCRMTARALARAEAALTAAGGRIVAILPETQAYAARLKSQAGARYPHLSDIDNGYALSLGLAFWLGEELAGLYRELGNEIRLYQGNAGWIVPIPACFVIGRNGLVLARFIDPDYRRRMAIEDLIAAVSAEVPAAEK